MLCSWSSRCPSRERRSSRSSALDVLRARGYAEEFIARAQGYLKNPGISVVAPALLAAEIAEVHAMHDPTEGGVMTGLLEMARAAGSGIAVDLDAIPVPEESARLCREFGLDPLGTIVSGAILAAVAAADAVRLAETLCSAGYPAARIGQMTEADSGLVAMRTGERVLWPTFATDEITKLFNPLP